MPHRPPSRRNFSLWEGCAWTVGLLCVCLLLLFRVQAGRAAQAAQRIAPGRSAGDGPAHGTARAHPVTDTKDLASFNGVIGRLEMPALGLSVPILNDYDPDSLRKGVGRIKGTGVPGGLGNFVVAGHRDTYFRPLRRIAPGMTMRVVTPDSTFLYIVDSTSIVTPDDVDVLDVGDHPEMTLITCYPFDFIGAAPKRFIVRARLTSVGGDTP